VTLYGHASVVTDNIDAILFDLPRGQIPVARVPDVRFIYLGSVNKQITLPELHGLAFQRDYPFEQHHLFACKTNEHHIVPCGL